MSIRIINNQVIDFKEISTTDCYCNGRKFIRKVNKNDITQVEFISTIVNSEPEFNNLGNWLFVINERILNPFPITPNFIGTNTVGVCDGSIQVINYSSFYLAIDQIEFSIDNGLNWYNQSSPASGNYAGAGLFINKCAGGYICVMRDLVYNINYIENLVIT